MMPPERPTTDLSRHWDKRPDYIGVGGMQLHPYQLEGLNWLRHSWSKKIDTILAGQFCEQMCAFDRLHFVCLITNAAS